MSLRIPPSTLPAIAGLDRKGPTAVQGQDAPGGFAEAARESIAATEASQQEAATAATTLAEGGGNVHEAALMMEKADIQMRLLVKARNKVVEAYQEIMRMPV